jgi:hypothetical protein
MTTIFFLQAASLTISLIRVPTITKYLSSVAFVALGLTGQPVEAAPRVLPPATRYDARVAVAWFNFLYDLIRLERLSPPVASRAIGIAGVTLYEAVQPDMPGYRSLSGQLNNLYPGPAQSCHDRL